MQTLPVFKAVKLLNWTYASEHISEETKKIATKLHPNRIEGLTIKELVLGFKFMMYGMMYGRWEK